MAGREAEGGAGQTCRDVPARYTTGDAGFFSPLLHEWRSSSTSRFPLFNLVGSAPELVSASGAQTDTYSLDAYGRTLASSGSTENPYRFLLRGTAPLRRTGRSRLGLPD